LTARQVMQRIESTAQHPPAGWNPLVGNGTVDALAAVSTDPTSPGNIAKPPPAQVPAASSPPREPENSHSRDTALRGVTMCLIALMCALIIGAAKRRLPGRSRGARDNIVGD
jgi:membrane-anchored mycosin MYCP